VSLDWRRVRSRVFRYAALVDGVHRVVLRLNGFPDHPLYTMFMDGVCMFDMDLSLDDHRTYEPLTPEERQEVLTLMRGLGPYGAEVGQPCDGDWCAFDVLTDDFAAQETP
jgi:hypothetical protein